MGIFGQSIASSINILHLYIYIINIYTYLYHQLTINNLIILHQSLSSLVFSMFYYQTSRVTSQQSRRLQD